ncbi:beta-glucoside operon transcriptional antiterminator [Breznakia sp. PF5-3]|uniref:BglG family transcription antiterminator LicT n=1 Tax=unclassified Breznakia TaxID=2623764 RepID=UPI0024071453|nr:MULTISPECIES: PRD domain-containing protein [unclassified Breznakia]MDF9823962.1 beta-glucoside operon transcriptional antiterminator [Breznakia sp. PM6-1]MDF9834761.1 beta-glucoside operon transcriptional antiterminator [Breznakia sp. PF5-3]MDF9838369.1 beta-glucoside operon transcriptional antiterminator [Breznakia sp. PFB2-8]MDF9860385.1 beta-glucoside operon transcriptional antiterminator [Breznakia sp. PH5-24]
MKIEKILNNNVVVIHDEKGLEKIVMGRGLAFKRKVGDEIDANMVDKEFYMANHDVNSRFQELVVDIPLEYLELGEDIVKFAKTHLGRKLNDSIYISIVDHMYTAIVRFQEGIVVKNALLWDTKRFYPDEFEVGKQALDMIEEKFKVRLPEDEAGFIALHIVNAQMEEEIEDVYEITKVMQEISNIVKYFFNVEFDEDSVYFYRFITHLKFFAQRLINHNTYASETEDDLLEVIKVKYRNAYECVVKITQFIAEKYDYVLSNEEQLYLTIHIERVIYKSDK